MTQLGDDVEIVVTLERRDGSDLGLVAVDHDRRRVIFALFRGEQEISLDLSAADLQDLMRNLRKASRKLR